MTVALSPEHGHLLEKLIVVDVAPTRGKISPDFAKYMEAMRRIEKGLVDGSVKTRKNADRIIEEYEKDDGIRQWLLTNLVKTDNNEQLHWRISLDNLTEGLDEIGKFPYESSEKTFDKPVLFIKGELSKYINRKSQAVAEGYFPNMKVETVNGAGHWVHAEKPAEFQQLLIDFCG